jgi:hypothetical protein
MSSPPPPYSLRPPPAYIHSQKPPARPPRQSSRQTLSKALQRARYAVQLDSSGSDIPSAIAAYDEAIELLQHVIARRSRKPGNKDELDRVMNIVSLPSPTIFPPFPLSLAASASAAALCRNASLLLYALAAHCHLFYFIFVSMTDMRSVYTSCVALAASAYRVM